MHFIILCVHHTKACAETPSNVFLCLSEYFIQYTYECLPTPLFDDIQGMGSVPVNTQWDKSSLTFKSIIMLAIFNLDTTQLDTTQCGQVRSIFRIQCIA